MTEACWGECPVIVCFVRSFSCQFKIDWAHNMLKDVCLSLFYLTIKLYLWGQSWQFSAAEGHFECVSTKGFLSALTGTEWLTGSLLETSNTHQSLVPHWPVYSKTFFTPTSLFLPIILADLFISGLGEKRSNITVIFDHIWTMSEMQTMNRRIRETEIKRSGTRICGWMTEQTETETAINH